MLEKAEIMRFRRDKAFSALERYRRSLQRAGSIEISTDFASQEIKIPTSIFHDRSIAVLEAIVEFLKEEKQLHFSQIAALLERDDRTIWTSYDRVKKKRTTPRDTKYSGLLIPISVFADRKISVMEALCFHMFSQLNLSYAQIAALLNRDQRTVWTCVNRAKRKYAKK